MFTSYILSHQPNIRYCSVGSFKITKFTLLDIAYHHVRIHLKIDHCLVRFFTLPVLIK